MRRAVGPRAAAAPVALPLEIDGSRLRSSRRQDTSLRGLLRLHGARHVELDQLPKMNEEIERISPKKLRVYFFFFFLISLENACLAFLFFDQSDANCIE